MADKEERIFIFTQQKACDICKKNLEEYDGLTPDCGNCSEKDFPSMTRPEAIEKGAKAICRQRASCAKGCTKCSACELWRNFVTHAEAVINDLLGVEQNGK